MRGPELGPYPFLDTLSDFEFNRKFYPDYREHVNHQLRVFWLGQYLFGMCGPIRERVLAEIGAGDEAAGTAEFLRRWCACAIYHDIGYVLECEGAAEPGSDEWNTVCRAINDTRHAPLSGLPMFSKRLGGRCGAFGYRRSGTERIPSHTVSPCIPIFRFGSMKTV